MTIRVAVVDDHRLFREALGSLFAEESGIEIVGEASAGKEAMAVVKSVTPNVLLLDTGLPDMSGADVARDLRAARSAVNILALSEHSERRFVQEMLKAGALGYLTKKADRSELVRAVRVVASGKGFLSTEVVRTLLSNYPCTCGSELHTPPLSCLGPRERDVLRLIADGEHSPAIAVRLGIAEGTVDAHRRNLMRKLGLHTVATLTKYAIREGLTTA